MIKQSKLNYDISKIQIMLTLQVWPLYSCNSSPEDLIWKKKKTSLRVLKIKKARVTDPLNYYKP